MSSEQPRRAPASRFSLRHLLTITALVAVGIAAGSAFRKHRSLLKYRDELRAISGRLQVDSDDQLASAAMPDIADDFDSWQVYVPPGQTYELRLGIGQVSDKAIPPVLGSWPIPAGRHRVTLHAEDSSSAGFHFVVYVDGEQVIEKSMGSEWMPAGWSSASGISWPHSSGPSKAPLQLSGKRYEPNRRYGTGNYFNAQSDSYTTRQGYRLWIDQGSNGYPPASPFLGHTGDPHAWGIGLRDGLRYQSGSPFHWGFARPGFATTSTMFGIEAEFLTSDSVEPATQGISTKSWLLSNSASIVEPLLWPMDPPPTTQTAFLHPAPRSDGGLRPVMELKWDAARPDEVGLRLADTPANSQIRRWRLRVLDGSQHLWREIQMGDTSRLSPADVLKTGQPVDKASGPKLTQTVLLHQANEAEGDLQLRWQTTEQLPLQIVGRKDQAYAGMRLYEGIPLKFGLQIPATMQPKVSVEVMEQLVPGTAFPGGPVFHAIRLELQASHDWLWFATQSNE